MAEITISFKTGANTITFYGLDDEKKLQIEVENGYKEYTSVYLTPENIDSLKNYLSYLKQLNKS